MPTRKEKTPKSDTRAIANSSVSHNPAHSKTGGQAEPLQRKEEESFQELANNSPQHSQALQFYKLANSEDEGETQAPVQKKENSTGLPDQLKAGVENLSGVSLDDVKVHRSSDKPAQLKAHAFAQGNDIHLAPGQERHLPHEAWHVVQQKQGRVKPTMQMKGQVNINDDKKLEKEADLMGRKANSQAGVSMSGLLSGSQPKDVVQPRLMDENGVVLSMDELKEKFKGTLYEKKLTDKLAESITHTHKTKSISKAVSAAYSDPLNKPLTDRIKGIGTAATPNEKETFNELERELSPENPRTYTLQNVKDYLDGKPVSGLSLLDKSGIKGEREDISPMKAGENWRAEQWDKEAWEKLSDAEKETERAKIIASTIKRLRENRAKQTGKEQKVTSTPDGGTRYEDEGTQALAEAFSKTTFYYGTTGEQDKAKVWETTMKWAKKAKGARMGKDVGTYSAGNRNFAFLNRFGETENHEMMDMYYGGQQFEAWHMMRNPLIGKYLHEMMGYAGGYDQTESPDTTFRKNYPLGASYTKLDDKGNEGDTWQNRGWSANSKTNDKNPNMKPLAQEWGEDKSATMEISRLIREGVRKWGGKIVMEVKNVVWDNIFGTRNRFGDTDMEVESFLPEFFAQGKKARMPWGKGEVIWTWGGKTEAVTKSRVRNDFWFGGPAPSKGMPGITPRNEGQFIKNRTDWYNQLDEGSASSRWNTLSTDDFGKQVDTLKTVLGKVDGAGAISKGQKEYLSKIVNRLSTWWGNSLDKGEQDRFRDQILSALKDYDTKFNEGQVARDQLMKTYGFG